MKNYMNDETEASKMIGILRNKYRGAKTDFARHAILVQAAKILDVFPELGKKPVVAREAEVMSNRDVIAVVGHKISNGVVIAWSHAGSNMIARDVIVSDCIDRPHIAFIAFVKSLLHENTTREVVTDLDSFVRIVNGSGKTHAFPAEIGVIRSAINAGKLVVRRPKTGNEELFFTQLHAECRRDS